MGVSYSCPGANALDESLETLFLRSMGFNSDKSICRSFTFNGRDSEPVAVSSGSFIIEGSLSFKGREMETTFSIKSPTSTQDLPRPFPRSRFSQESESEALPPPPPAASSGPKHFAALKVQKVYKSFRTRRQLADCAVLVEQRWWKVLDFALLKRNSVSFFDIDHPESAVSKWSRARMRAAKLGKGLSKDDNAQKLALQHWLEAIDPRHRYGHNLHFYYDCWLHCESKQPFFYWLDVGEGKEVNLEDRCPRSKLQQQCIKYLGPKEREAYEIVVEDGKLYYKNDKKFLDTSEGPKDTKWIFVLSTSKKLYVGQKQKGLFQHSSFLAGGATSAAGRLVVEKGIMKAVWPHSGHYQPTEENFHEFINFLKQNKVDLTDVKESPTDDEDESYIKPESSKKLTSNFFKQDLIQSEMNDTSQDELQGSSAIGTSSKKLSNSCDDVASIEGAKTDECDDDHEIKELVEEQTSDDGQEKDRQYCHSKEMGGEEGTATPRTIDVEPRWRNSLKRSLGHRYKYKEAVLETPTEYGYKFRKQNLFAEEHEEGGEEVPHEKILHRIKSKKGMESFQLGNHLPCTWTTGAGPRIGFVRDYPSELQFRTLEQMNLSPKSNGPSKSFGSPRSMTCAAPKAASSSFVKD